ncbi:MAG: hypothetical protein IKQ72_06095 [Bacteroidaceae bacterium]|nr:hypothetical protein [Bacteroidaceae bacterium]
MIKRIISLVLTMCSLTCMAQVTDYLKIGNTIKFNKENYTLGWSSHPNDGYYIQEYFPKGEKPETFKKMFTINVLVAEGITPQLAAQAKCTELDNRKKTDNCCHYKKYENKKSGEYMIDFLVSNGEKGKEPTVVEFNLYRYKAIKVNGKNAIQLSFYSQRAYNADVYNLLSKLVDIRTDVLSKMLDTDVKVGL